MFPKISSAKSKEDIFVGLHIRRIMLNKRFERSLDALELDAWKAFKLISSNFLGNYKPTAYADGAQSLFNSYQKLGCHMLAFSPRFSFKS